MTCFLRFRRRLKYFLGLHEVGQIKFILMARSEGILEDIIFLSLSPLSKGLGVRFPVASLHVVNGVICGMSLGFPKQVSPTFPLFFNIPF